MQRLNINLSSKKKQWERSVFFILWSLVIVSLFITGITVHDYLINYRSIDRYTERLKDFQNRRESMPVTSLKALEAAKLLRNENKRKIELLSPLIQNNLFSVSDVLSFIELKKPDNIIITELQITNNLRSFVLKGSSLQSSQVTAFIKKLSSDDQVSVELKKEEFSSNQLVVFELFLEWNT